MGREQTGDKQQPQLEGGASSPQEVAIKDEQSLQREFEQRKQEFLKTIDGNSNLSEADKAKMKESVKTEMAKSMKELGSALVGVEQKGDVEKDKAVAALNNEAVRILESIRQDIAGGREISPADLASDAYKRQVARTNLLVDQLRSLVRLRDEAKVEGGVFEAISGHNQSYYNERIASVAENIKGEVANLTILAQATGADKGQLALILDNLKFYTELDDGGLWTELGHGLTSKQGLADSADFLKNYATGTVKGVLTMVDPRTYLQLAKLVGEGTASLIYCDDNWEKVKGLIKGAGESWDNADPNGKAEMLGQFMGSILGTKGLGMGLKAGRAAMLGKVEGTVLGADVGAGASRVASKVGEVAARAGEKVGEKAGNVAKKAAEVAAATAEFVATKLETVLKKMSEMATKVRGRIASLTDAEMKELMEKLSDAERAVADGKKLAPKGQLLNLKYRSGGGRLALDAAKRAVPDLYKEIEASLASKAILPAVKDRLIALKGSVVRLGESLGNKVENVARKVGEKAGDVAGRGKVATFEKAQVARAAASRAKDVAVEAGANLVARIGKELRGLANALKTGIAKGIGNAEAKALADRIAIKLNALKTNPKLLGELQAERIAPAIQADLADVYGQLGDALKSQFGGYFRAPFEGMTKMFKSVSAKGGKWADAVLEKATDARAAVARNVERAGKAISPAAETASSVMAKFGESVKGLSNFVKLNFAKLLGGPETQAVVRNIEQRLTQIETNLKLVTLGASRDTFNALIRADLAELYGNIGSALKADVAGLLKAPYARMTKIFEGLSARGEKWADAVLEKGRTVRGAAGRAGEKATEVAASAAARVGESLKGLANYAKLNFAKVLGGSEAKAVVRNIENRLAQIETNMKNPVLQEAFRDSLNAQIRSDLAELYGNIGSALKADVAGLLKAPYARMTKILDGLSARGGAIGKWAQETRISAGQIIVGPAVEGLAGAESLSIGNPLMGVAYASEAPKSSPVVPQKERQDEGTSTDAKKTEKTEAATKNVESAPEVAPKRASYSEIQEKQFTNIGLNEKQVLALRILFDENTDMKIDKNFREKVRGLQKELNAIYSSITVDKNKPKSALVEDGIFGPKTFAMLKLYGRALDKYRENETAKIAIKQLMV